jgi:hypothetical protein
MAGRDSVAAAIVAVQTEGFTDLLPVYAYTGTEYGPWTSVETAVDRLRHRLPRTHVHDLLVLGSPHFWHALNGRFMSELLTIRVLYPVCGVPSLPSRCAASPGVDPEGAHYCGGKRAS